MNDKTPRSLDLREILAALDMPPEGLRRWFERNRAFCNSHGGERLYREWLELYEQCRAELDTTS